MKRTFSELIEAIPVHEERLGNGHAISALCPICGQQLKAPVLGDVHQTIAALQNNIVTHVRYAHPEE
jgi:hypothetical protein